MKMKLALAALALSQAGCVNGKLNPVVAPVVSAFDTAACELVTVYVANQEAGDVCTAAAGFFNKLLSGLSAPLPSAAITEKPHKFPVRMGGITVGHFRRPFDVQVQAKLDALPPDAGVDLDGGTP